MNRVANLGESSLPECLEKTHLDLLPHSFPGIWGKPCKAANMGFIAQGWSRALRWTDGGAGFVASTQGLLFSLRPEL